MRCRVSSVSGHSEIKEMLSFCCVVVEFVSHLGQHWELQFMDSYHTRLRAHDKDLKPSQVNQKSLKPFICFDRRIQGGLGKKTRNGT